MDIDIGKYEKYNFWNQGHKSITILVYRNILFLYQDQFFDFRKEKHGCNYGFCKTRGSVIGVAGDSPLLLCYAMLS